MFKNKMFSSNWTTYVETKYMFNNSQNVCSTVVIKCMADNCGIFACVWGCAMMRNPDFDMGSIVFGERDRV